MVILGEIAGNCGGTLWLLTGVGSAILGAVFVAFAVRGATGTIVVAGLCYPALFAASYILTVACAPTEREIAVVRQLLSQRESIAVEILSDPDRPVHGGVRFRARVGGAELLVTASDLPWTSSAELRRSDRFLAALRVKPACSELEHRPNPFSYEGYLFRRGIAGTAQVTRITQIVRHRDEPPQLERFLRRLTAAMEPRPELGVILASTIAEADLLDTFTAELFRRTGLTHVLVVSGYQVGVLFVLALTVLKALLGRVRMFTIYVPTDIAATFGAFVLASAYGYLTAGALTTVRALIALAVFALSRVVSRPVHVWRNYCAVLLCSLLLWPGAIFEAGSQLMFSALAGLVAAHRLTPVLEARFRLKRSFAALLAGSLLPSIFTTPIVLAWFHLLVPLSPVFNLVFAPALCAVCTTFSGAALLGFWTGIPGSLWLLEAATAATTFLLEGIEWVSDVAALLGLGARELSGIELFGAGMVSLVLLMSAVRISFFRSCNTACERDGTVALTAERLRTD